MLYCTFSLQSLLVSNRADRKAFLWSGGCPRVMGGAGGGQWPAMSEATNSTICMARGGGVNSCPCTLKRRLIRANLQTVKITCRECGVRRLKRVCVCARVCVCSCRVSCHVSSSLTMGGGASNKDSKRPEQWIN